MKIFMESVEKIAHNSECAQNCWIVHFQPIKCVAGRSYLNHAGVKQVIS